MSRSPSTTTTSLGTYITDQWHGRAKMYQKLKKKKTMNQ